MKNIKCITSDSNHVPTFYEEIELEEAINVFLNFNWQKNDEYTGQFRLYINYFMYIYLSISLNPKKAFHIEMNFVKRKGLFKKEIK